MKKPAILILSAILLSSCGSENSAENNQTQQTQTEEQQAEASSKYMLKENGVEPFFTGNNMPDEAAGYTIEKKIVRRDFEDETDTMVTYTMSVYFIFDNGVNVFEIETAFDFDSKESSDIIGEITILSDKYKTAEGIGVNSTIQDFITAYPDYTVWYTYISGMYVIETKQLEVQFLLDGDDYIGKEIEIEIESDIIFLKSADFKKDAKIKSVRIF